MIKKTILLFLLYVYNILQNLTTHILLTISELQNYKFSIIILQTNTNRLFAAHY